jgi:hypothetical protein
MAETFEYRVANRDDETDILAVLEEVAPKNQTVEVPIQGERSTSPLSFILGMSLSLSR